MAKKDNSKDKGEKSAEQKRTKNKKGAERVIKEIIIERASIREWAQAVGIIGVLILLVFLLLIFKGSFMPKKQVVFDLKETYKTFFKQAYRQNLTKAQIEFLGKEFPLAIDYAVINYANEHHAVVFNKSAVIAGLQDVTPEIEGGIAKEMQVLAKKHR